MAINFSKSVILGYGPTEKTHCQICKGPPTPLKKGFAFHCRDTSTGEEYVAGPVCRLDIDKSTKSSLPHFGAANPIPESNGKEGARGKAKGGFRGVSNNDQLVADMAAWVQLRQDKLPKLGFSKIAFKRLEVPMHAITNGTFNIDHAKEVYRIYDNLTKGQPHNWSLENLQKCYDTAMQIERIANNSNASATNHSFLNGIKNRLTSRYDLTEGQIKGLNNVARYHGESEWTQNLKF